MPEHLSSKIDIVTWCRAPVLALHCTLKQDYHPETEVINRDLWLWTAWAGSEAQVSFWWCHQGTIVRTVALVLLPDSSLSEPWHNRKVELTGLCTHLIHSCWSHSNFTNHSSETRHKNNTITQAQVSKDPKAFEYNCCTTTRDFFYVCKVIKSITKNNSFQKKKKNPKICESKLNEIQWSCIRGCWGLAGI